MVENADLAQQRLNHRAWVLMHQDMGLLGFGDELAHRLIGNLINKNQQDFLYAAVEYTIGVPGFFQTKRSILEAGCGTCAFVYSALERGHDAYGIDNDRNRLAVAYAKIPAYGYAPEWKDRALLGDATATPFEAGRFDVVVGHQFIEHVRDVPGSISELVRVTKPGGFIVFYAPDYRAPYEAHYQIPWPPFATRQMAETWVEAFERPTGFIEMFNYVTLPQVGAVFEALDCQIVSATIDRQIDPTAARLFDVSSTAALAKSAQLVRTAFEAGTLPENFRAATSFAIAARKR